MGESRLTTLKVSELSLVDSPAVRKAKFIIAKRAVPEPDVTLEAVEKRVAPQGYTSSSPGATSPAHVHDYSLWLDVEDGVVRVRGWVDECCDHTHRFTLEGYLRGEVEESDGHMHALMTIKEVRAMTALAREVAKGMDGMSNFAQEQVKVVAISLLKAQESLKATIDDDPMTDDDLARLEAIRETLSAAAQ